MRGAVVRALTVGELEQVKFSLPSLLLHEREKRGRRVHRCTKSVAIDEEQQNVEVAAALGQHDVIAAWQRGRRLKIHCITTRNAH